MRSAFSNKRDPVAGAIQLLRGSQSRPGPEPTTATRLPVRVSGGSGLIQPSFQACSTIVFSITLIVTGGSLMPSTQAASQGAGQMRPVNSGKLLVECRTRIASFHWSLINQVVPVGNDVVDRAAGVAERNAAIHAARGLRAHFFFRERLIDLEVVVDALGDGATRRESRACIP